MKAVVVRLICVFLGVIFTVSGCIKIRLPYDFLYDVYRYELVGPWPGEFIAAVLPFVEVVIGVALIIGFLTEGALLVSGLLAVVFSIAQATVLLNGLEISCGCFGASSQVSYYTIGRSLLILLLAIGAFALRVTVRTEEPGGNRDQQPANL